MSADKRLLAAIERENFEAVKNILQKEKIKHSTKPKAIFEAVNSQNIDIMKLLISYEIEVTGAAFLNAVNLGDPSVVEVLLESYNHLTNDALVVAINNNNSEMVELLLNHNFPTEDENLTAAVKNEDSTIVGLLLDKGVEATEEALLAAIEVNNFDIVNILLNNKRDLINTEGLLIKVLINTSETEQEDDGIFDLLIKRGADIHEQNEEALIISVEREEVDHVETLLRSGADVHARNDMAIRANQNEYIARLLLEAGANVRANNDEALKKAVSLEDEQLVEVLLDYGASANALYEENPILFEALDQENFDIIKSLLKHGADPRFIDDEGFGPLKGYYSSYEVTKLLLEYGADVHESDDTLLIDKIPDYDIVKLLLEYKADLHKHNDDIVFAAVNVIGKRDLPYNNRHMKVLRLLILYGANPQVIIDSGVIIILRQPTIKLIFDTYLSTVKLGSKEAWDFYIIWAPWLRGYERSAQDLEGQKKYVWGEEQKRVIPRQMINIEEESSDSEDELPILNVGPRPRVEISSSDSDSD
jgi:ankyrin repeat protein